jgi:hypothetical protein
VGFRNAAQYPTQALSKRLFTKRFVDDRDAGYFRQFPPDSFDDANELRGWLAGKNYDSKFVHRMASAQD